MIGATGAAFREPAADRIVEAEPAILRQLEHQRRGELLSHRSGLVDRAVRRGDVMLDVGLAPPSGQEEAVAPKHRHREARNALPRHLATHVSVDRIERGRRGRRLNGRGEQHREKERWHGLTFGFCSATLGRGLRGWRNDTGTGSGAKLGALISLAAADREGLPPRLRHAEDAGALRPLNIRTLQTGPGVRTSLLRILMTNACSFNCHYCPMRRDRNMPRTLLKPEELVRIFLGARRRGWVRGALHHHRHSRPPGACDGRSHPRARAAPRSPTASADTSTSSWCRARKRRRSSGSPSWPAECRSTSRRRAGPALARIAPDKSSRPTLGDLERFATLVVQRA